MLLLDSGGHDPALGRSAVALSFKNVRQVERTQPALRPERRPAAESEIEG